MTIFAWIGAILVLLFAVWIVVMSVGWAVCQFRQLYVQLGYKADALARRDVGNRLMMEAYWYSEDEAVMSAIDIIGRKLSQGGYYDISQAREEWRGRKGKANGSDQKS